MIGFLAGMTTVRGASGTMFSAIPPCDSAMSGRSSTWKPCLRSVSYTTQDNWVGMTNARSSVDQIDRAVDMPASIRYLDDLDLRNPGFAIDLSDLFGTGAIAPHPMTDKDQILAGDDDISSFEGSVAANRMRDRAHLAGRVPRPPNRSSPARTAEAIREMMAPVGAMTKVSRQK